MFNLSRTTVNRWIKQYSIELTSLSHRIYNNKVYEKIKANKQLKLDLKTSNLNILQFLITVLNNNPFLSKKELAVILSKQFDIKFNIYKISLFISKLRYTYKKPRQYSVKNNIFLNKLIADRKNFVVDIKQKQLDKIISIDECGTTCIEKATLFSIHGYM